MKITRTIGLVSAAMMGMGLLSSCAQNREHQAHHRHHHHHQNVPHQHEGHHHNEAKHPVQQKAKTAAKRTAMSFGDVVAKARTGDADAQYALGYMYYYGQDVERNNEKARFWIEKSANQGHENAITALRLLGKSSNQLASNNTESAAVARTHRESNSSNQYTQNGERLQNRNAQANQVAQSEDQEASQSARSNRYTQNDESRLNQNTQPAQYTQNEARRFNQQGQGNQSARNGGQQFNQQNQANWSARNEGQQFNKQAQSNQYARNESQQFNQQSQSNQANQNESQRFNRQGQSNSQAQNEGRRRNEGAQANQFAQRDQQGLNNNNQSAQQATQPSETMGERNTERNTASNADSQAGNATSQLAQSEDKGLAVALNKVNSNPSQLTAHEKSLIDLPNHHYTLQLYGARKLDLAEGIIAKNNLGDHAKIYHTKFQNKDWYVLVYGNYNSASEAIHAISKLPPAVQKLKPWAKPVATVKEGIRASLATSPVS